MSQVCILLPLIILYVVQIWNKKEFSQNWQYETRFIITTDKFVFRICFIYLCTLFSVAPVLHKVQSTQFVLTNHSSYLWCPAEGAPAPFIVWKKNGIIVQNSTSIRHKLDIAKGNKETFSCEVKNNNQVTKKELVPYMESKF